MAAKIQVARSSVPGARPTTGARAPGELYVNWPDNMLGVINAANAPVDLLAVRYFSPLASYVAGQFVVQAGSMYVAAGAVPAGAFNASQWTQMAAGAYLPLTGGTLTGGLTVAPAAGGANLFLNIAASGSNRQILGQTNGLTRWVVVPGTSAAEGTGNVGSDFEIRRYDDSGVFVDSPVQISRATGRTLFIQSVMISAQPLTMNGPINTIRQIIGASGGANRWAVSVANDDAETGTGNAGSNFSLTAYDDTGTLLGTCFKIFRASGLVVLSGHGATSFSGGAAGYASLFLNKSSVAGVQSIITGAMNAKQRWNLVLGNGVAEAGSNAGSDFVINRYTDAGVLIDSPLSISRQYGGVTLLVSSNAGPLNYPHVDGASGLFRGWGYTTGNLSRWFVGANELTETGGSVGSDFTVIRYNDAGTVIDRPLTITRSSGLVTVGTLSATGMVTLAQPLVLSNTVAANSRYIEAQTSGSSRWQIVPGNNSAESGSNAGSNFVINRYADNGSFLGTALQINRATGATTLTSAAITGTLSTVGTIGVDGIAGTHRGIAASTGGSSRWLLSLANPTPEGGSNAGSDFALYRYTDGAVFVDTPLVISRANGGATFSAGATFSSAVYLDGTVAAGARVLQGKTSGSLRWQIAMGNTAAESGSNAGSDFTINRYSDAAAPLGSMISGVRSTGVVTFQVAIVNGPSDATLKQNVAPLTDSLAKVLQLQGVSFEMIGDETKRRQIGFIAQDVEPIVPEVIQDFQNFDEEGNQKEPLLAIDYPKLTAVLIEAVKELTARVTVLEGV